MPIIMFYKVEAPWPPFASASSPLLPVSPDDGLMIAEDKRKTGWQKE